MLPIRSIRSGLLRRLSWPLSLSFALLACGLSGAASAQVDASGLPGDAIWYLHADLDELRKAGSGKEIYQWLDDEVFADLREDLGIDLSKETDSLTAFSDAELGTVIIVDGAITEDTRDKLLALAASDSKLDAVQHDGKTYYHADRSKSRHKSNRSLDDLEEAAYFSFDIKDKLIVASDRNQMEALLERGGRIAGNQSHPGALLVMTADKSFVQAGVRTGAFANGRADNSDQDGSRHGWDSNILRNTEQVALLVSDSNGLLSVEAQLVSREPTMAQSLGGIINGLISLQALNPDLDPDILALLRTTKIDVKDRVLSINAVVNPGMIVSMLDD